MPNPTTPPTAPRPVPTAAMGGAALDKMVEVLRIVADDGGKPGWPSSSLVITQKAAREALTAWEAEQAAAARYRVVVERFTDRNGTKYTACLTFDDEILRDTRHNELHVSDETENKCLRLLSSRIIGHMRGPDRAAALQAVIAKLAEVEGGPGDGD